MKRIAPFLLFILLIPLAWPHLFLKGQVPVDGNVLRLFYPDWVFLHAHPPLPWKWPLWNPYRNMGEPFLADPQSLAAYPPMWLLCRLSSYLNFLRFWVAGHTILATYFMGQWVWRRTKDSAAAASSAAIVAFNGFFMAHATLLNHFASAAYVPMVFYFFDFENQIGLGLALALQWLAGFPPFSYVTGLALVGWSFLSGTSKRRLLLRASGLAAGLAALQLIPFMELFLHSSRPVFLDLANAINFSEPGRQLLRMLFVPQWYAWRPQLTGDPAVVSFYVGPFVCLSAGWALWKGQRRERLVFLAAVACVFLSLGAHLPGYTRIIFLRFFRFPANWLLISVIGLAWLAGIGIFLLTPKRRRWMGTALILVDLLAFAQYVRVPWFSSAYLEEPPPMVRTMLVSFPAQRIYHSPLIMQALERQTLKEGGEYLFFKEFLPPSYGMAFGIREVESYQVLKLARAELFQKRLAAEGPSSPLLRWAGIGTIITRSPGQVSLGPDNIQVLSLKAQASLLFFEDDNGAGKVDIQSDEADKIQAQVNTDKTNTLVFSEVAYPGWRAYVDGKRELPGLFQNTFLSVQVPSGKHNIEFHFMSFSFWIGLFISLTTGMVLWIC
jgi:hypothetical protein